MSAIFDTPVHTSAQNLDRVLAAGRPTLLVFETPTCEPCRTLAPTLKELARDFAGRALIVEVDDAQEGNLVTRFRLTRVPALILWQGGHEIGRIEGAADASAIRAHVNFLVGAIPRPPAASGPSTALGTASYQTTSAGAGVSRQGPTYQSTSQQGAAQDGAPVVVTDATFQSQVLQAPQPVLVDFWAPWCGPCRMVSPIVEELGREYSGRLRVAKVNTDENPAHAGRLGIQGIPTLIFFKNGREVDRVVGAVPKGTLRNHLERVLNS